METRYKNLLIGGLFSLILVMAICYSAFATQLNINGTSNITSSWDVHIKSITPGTPVGNAVNKSATVGDSKLSATFAAELLAPNDSITYTIEVENSGSLDAKLSSLTFTPGASAAITYSYDNIAKDDVIAAGGTKEFTVTVAYNNINTQPTEADKTSALSMVLSFIQA